MKIQSTLPQGEFYVHLAVMLDVVILVFVLVLISSNITPQFGFSVKMPESNFLMDNVSGEKHIVSITAGDNPAVFFNSKRLEGGLSGLSKELDRIVAESQEEHISKMGVILVLDKAVSRAVEQEAIEAVLKRNIVCSVASEPAN